MKKHFFASRAGDIFIFVLACVLLYASFTATPAEAYLFPRLAAVLLAIFCAMNLAMHCRERIANLPVDGALLAKLAPGFAAMFLYIALAEAAGFYPASCAVLLFLSWHYADKSGRRLPVALAASATAMALVYLLFAVILQAQTPPPFWVQ